MLIFILSKEYLRNININFICKRIERERKVSLTFLLPEDISCCRLRP